MTKWQLGRKDEARRLLERTLPDVEKELQSPSRLWQERIVLEVLHREAEAMIGQTPLTAPHPPRTARFARAAEHGRLDCSMIHPSSTGRSPEGRTNASHT
jgi:hypothetical protein